MQCFFMACYTRLHCTTLFKHIVKETVNLSFSLLVIPVKTTFIEEKKYTQEYFLLAATEQQSSETQM